MGGCLLAVPARAEDDDASSDTGSSGEAGGEAGEEIGGEAGEEIVVVEAEAADLAQRTMSQEEVRRSAAENVAELVDRDVAVTAATGGRGERRFMVRGFEQRQVAVFIDGVPAAIPYDGYQDLGKFPASLVESITLTPGPAAGIYGPDSLGGTVRVRTRPPPEHPEQYARIEGATHGALGGSGYAGGPVGPVRLRVGGGGRSSPGFPLPDDFEPTSREDGGLRDASDYRSQDAHLRVLGDLGAAGTVNGGLNFLQGDYGVPTSLYEDRARHWRFSTYRDVAASVRHATPSTSRLRTEEAAWFAANTNILDAYDTADRVSQEESGSFHSTYADHRVGGVARLALPTAWLDYRSWLFTDHQVHRSQDDTGEAWERISTTLVSTAVAAETSGDAVWGGFAGLEVDGEFPGQGVGFEPAPLFLGPSVGVRFEPGRRFRSTLGLARRARSPTLKERFSEGMGYREPNLDLAPETAWHVGLDLQAVPVEGTVVELSLYDAEVSNLIEEVPLGDGQVQMQNVGTARLAGAEAAVQAWHPGWLTSRAAVGLLYARLPDEPSPDDRLEYRPTWQATWSETLHPGTRFELRGSVQFVGPQWFLDDDTLEWGRLGSFWVVGAYAAVRPTPGSTLRLRAENLFDASYQTHYGYPEAGREIRLELELVR